MRNVIIGLLIISVLALILLRPASIKYGYSLSASSVNQGETSTIEFLYGEDDSTLWKHRVYIYLDDAKLLTVNTDRSFSYSLDTMPLSIGEHRVRAVIQRMCTSNDCGGSSSVRGNLLWIPGNTYQQYYNWECNSETHLSNVRKGGSNWAMCDTSSGRAGNRGQIRELVETFHVYPRDTIPTTTDRTVGTTTPIKTRNAGKTIDRMIYDFIVNIINYIKKIF